MNSARLCLPERVSFFSVAEQRANAMPGAPNRVNCRSRLTIALRIHCTPQWERNHAKAVRPNKSALQRYQPFRSAEIPRSTSASGMHRYQPAEKKRTLMTAKQETGEKKNLTGDTSARRHRKIAI